MRLLNKEKTIDHHFYHNIHNGRVVTFSKIRVDFPQSYGVFSKSVYVKSKVENLKTRNK
jgi:hypothetical protein